jgi:hypothetical protein
MSFLLSKPEAWCGIFRVCRKAEGGGLASSNASIIETQATARSTVIQLACLPITRLKNHHTYSIMANALNTIYRFAIPLAAGFGLAQASLYDVKGGNRAIIFDRLSGVREGVVNEGTHFLIPWLQKAIVYDVRTKPRNISTTTGSKDLQMVSLTLRVLHRPEVSKLSTIYQVRDTLRCHITVAIILTDTTEPRPRLRRARPPLHRKRSPQSHRGTIRRRRAHHPA